MKEFFKTMLLSFVIGVITSIGYIGTWLLTIYAMDNPGWWKFWKRGEKTESVKDPEDLES